MPHDSKGFKIANDHNESDISDEIGEDDIDEVLQTTISDADDYWDKTDNAIYNERIKGMRVQFAWAIFATIIIWLSVILLLVVSVGIQKLYPLLIYRLATIVMNSLVGGIIAYSLIIILIEWKRCKDTGKDQLPLITALRRSSQYVSVAISLIIGVLSHGYFMLWGHNVEHIEIPLVSLSDTVLVTLITTTTASVLGILAGVMYWLFPRNNSEAKPADRAAETKSPSPCMSPF